MPNDGYCTVHLAPTPARLNALLAALEGGTLRVWVTHRADCPPALLKLVDTTLRDGGGSLSHWDAAAGTTVRHRSVVEEEEEEEVVHAEEEEEDKELTHLWAWLHETVCERGGDPSAALAELGLGVDARLRDQAAEYGVYLTN